MVSSRFFKSLLVTLALCSFALAILPGVKMRGTPTIPKFPAPLGDVVDHNGVSLPPLDKVYYFDQLIDHNNTHLGTFKQRYWSSWKYYKPGGPIILTTPGENDADGFDIYHTNFTINGLIAQRENGATILIEHRFFGSSNPYNDLSSQSLELLTIQQAIEDLVYFAQNVHLPMPGGDQVKPHQAPWILMGGSYAGALTTWTMANKPGVFWAGYSSSGVVEAITDFHKYFTPIRDYMPKNCSADVEAVITYLDESYTKQDTAALDSLKAVFGLSGLSHIDDFASALEINLLDWQQLQPFRKERKFFEFCDALEIDDNVAAGQEGWGLQHTLRAWGNFWNTTYYPFLCGNQTAEDCLGTYNASLPYYTSTATNNTLRSWSWMTCNQLGWFQTGPSDQSQPAIVSRILQPAYTERQCSYFFPEAFSKPRAPTVEQTNSDYQGWNVNVDRLFFANGLRDPWREATISAECSPKGSTLEQPIFEGGGYHTSDMIIENGVLDPTIEVVQDAALLYMKVWLSEWTLLNYK